MLITTLVISFLVCCRLEVRCGYVGVVSGLQHAARDLSSTKTFDPSRYSNPPTHFVPNLSRWSPESRTKLSAQIRTYDDVFELLNYIIKSSRLNILLKFRCKASLKRSRNLNLSLRREPRRFWSLPRGLLQDIEWNEQRVATTGKGFMWDACYGISKESIRIPRPARIWCLMYSGHLQELVYSHLYCWALQ